MLGAINNALIKRILGSESSDRGVNLKIPKYPGKKKEEGRERKAEEIKLCKTHYLNITRKQGPSKLQITSKYKNIINIKTYLPLSYPPAISLHGDQEQFMKNYTEDRREELRAVQNMI